MKILIVAPSCKMGGIERALSVLANEWAKQGYEVVYVSCLKSVPFYQLHENIKLVEPDFRRTGGVLNKLFFYPKLLRYLRNEFKVHQPDRILSFGDFFNPLMLLAARGLKIPTYISDRTIPDYKFKFPIPQLKKWLYPQSTGFIAQTTRAKDFKIKQFGEKLRVKIIPNALPEFDKDNLNHVQREKKIIYVGRFAWEKDPEILIRAFAHVSKKYPSWTLEMAGTGPLLDPMKALVKELSLEAQVCFLGKVSDVASLYQSASILVLPSVVEGFPNTLIEAMSFGLTTVCFSEIPYEDIITHRIDGWVVKERTPEVLSEAIQLLIEKEAFRTELGTHATYSVQRFEKQIIAQQVLAFMKV